jgi:integration host factor subunit beta
MTRSDLIAALASKFPALRHDDVAESTHLMIDAIGNALAAGRRAEIRDFGAFSVTAKAARIGRNPKTGEKVSVPAKFSPHFKPGKELAKRVNASRTAA